MTYPAVVVLTFKSAERIIQEGGTSAWKLHKGNARRCTYAVCTRNRYAPEVEGSEQHHSAFLVGKVKDVVVAPGYDDRYLMRFSEYALVDLPEVWKGDRNPVRYSSLDALNIDPTQLQWRSMPKQPRLEPPEFPVTTGGDVKPLTMAEAKKGLSLTFGVAPESIEITIRG
jgi:hypothetical protein